VSVFARALADIRMSFSGAIYVSAMRIDRAGILQE
jgi:hypothetical protein